MEARSFWLMPLVLGLSGASAGQDWPLAEILARRQALLARLPDGLVLLHARSGEPPLRAHGFYQDASFLYFTGLASQPDAILLLDGPRKESVLFVPDPPRSFGLDVPGVSLVPDEAAARRHGLDRVRHVRELTSHLANRIAEGARRFYLDEPRRPVPRGNPPDLAPMAGEQAIFRHALELAFPDVELASAAAVIREMRWTKSPSEIAVLRDVARASASALRTGILAVAPGARQRETEAAVVAGCIEAGAEGPSFWPWTMSGENSLMENLVASFYDYRHLDRVMAFGELVRMDVGCDLRHYEGDVGRTVPVAGKFSPEQAEAWDLLVRAYRAGVAAMRAGRTHAELAEASRQAVREAEPTLRTDSARRAAREMLEGKDGLWHLHGVGLEAGEERLDRLEAGSVVAYEPMVVVGSDAFYLEDMILVTETGHEILSAGLPYTAAEIAELMAPR